MSWLLSIEPRLDPPAYMVPECPVCREGCDVYFLDINRDIVGCDCCRREFDDFDSVADAWEWRDI